MSSTLLIVISTIIILGGATIFSIYLGKKSSDNDWEVGGRNLPLYVIVGTQYATAMGGGMLVAHVGIGYSNGWSAMTYGCLVAAGLLLLGIIAKWLRQQEFTTIPDIIANLYGNNKTLLLLTCILTMVVPFGWICTQLVAFGKLYSNLTGIPQNWLMVIFAMVSLAFVLPAGLKSVAWTDFIFGCLMIAVSFISLGVIFKMGGGWSNIVAKLPSEIVKFPKGMGSVGISTILLWSLSIIPGTLTNQMYYQRVFAADKVNSVRKSLVISGLVIISADAWASAMGISIRALNGGLEPEMASGWFLTQVPNWFLAIYSGFLVATIMSTIDSAIHSISVNLTRDIYKKILHPEAGEDKLNHLSKVYSVGIAAIAVALSILYPRALDWVIATYAFSAAGLLFPIFAGILLKDKESLTVQGAIGSMICGFIGCIVGMITKSNIPYVAYGLVGSFLGLFIISLITKDKIDNLTVKSK
jgi:SSS family solute:Na+ symporter